MFIGEVKERVGKIFDTDPTIAVNLVGSPGVGKSAIIHQIAEERGVGVVDLRLITLNPVDFRGCPDIVVDVDEETKEEKRRTVWTQPDFFPDEKVDGSKGILFLDELNSAPTAIQAASYQLIYDRKVGKYELPDGWMIVIAGNTKSDRAIVHRMPSPLANRLIHYSVEVNLDSWVDWALEKGVSRKAINYLRWKPQNLFSFDKDKYDGAWPSPRSWETVSKMLSIGLRSLDDVGACVGEGAAAEFMSFIQLEEDLPDIRKALDAGRVDPVPDNLSVVFALEGAILELLESEKKDRWINNALGIATQINRDMGVLMVRDILKIKGFAQKVLKAPNSKLWEGILDSLDLRV